MREQEKECPQCGGIVSKLEFSTRKEQKLAGCPFCEGNIGIDPAKPREDYEPSADFKAKVRGDKQ